MQEAAAVLVGFGQQVLQQQQQGGEQPTVCFAAIPLMIPAAVVLVRSLVRQLRRHSVRPA